MLSNLDGSGKRVLVKANIKLPSSITYSKLSKQLLWSDSLMQTIESINMNGTARKILYHRRRVHVMASTLNKIYIANYSSSSLQSCQMKEDGLCQMVRANGRKSEGILSIIPYGKDFQPHSKLQYSVQFNELMGHFGTSVYAESFHSLDPPL